MDKTQPLLLLVATTLFTLFTGANAMAQGPSVRPDWSKSSTHTINLSGQTVTFTIPGNTSSDIPTTFKETLNIYDPKGYNEANSQELVKLWWDYKKRSMLFFTDPLGTLEFQIVISKPSVEESGLDLFQPGKLEASLRDIYDHLYNDPKDQTRIPKQYEPLNQNGLTWIKFTRPGGKTDEDRICYAIPMTTTHILEVCFRAIRQKDYDEDGWYAAAISDMEKMMDSFKITYTESSQEK